MNYPQSILSDGSYRRLFIGGENVGNFAAATDLEIVQPGAIWQSARTLQKSHYNCNVRPL